MGGNLTLQPAYRERNFTVPAELKNTNKIMSDSFFIGCHPFITPEAVEFIIKTFAIFFKKYI